MAISGDIKQNYTNLHDSTGETYQSIARRVENHGDRALGAWLREQAAAAGEDITPIEATPAGADTVRSYDANTVAELRDELTARGIENTQFKTKPELIGALQFDDAEQTAKEDGDDGQGAATTTEDGYSELTDDEVRQLAAEAGLETEGDRAEIIARLDAAKPAAK